MIHAPSSRRLPSLLILAALIGLCLVIGYVGSLFTTPKIDDWYATLEKPSFNPPNWVFGPVWTTLYISMGVAAWLAWRGAGGRILSAPATLFAVQLALNLAWSIAFFGAESPSLGLAVIAPLWIVIAGTIAAFWSLSRTGALLLVPYLVWVSFAAALNFEVWRLN